MKNLKKTNGILISSRLFTMKDQYEFAKFSADSNPIHIDPIAARRSISGECIVHGIHGLMWALNVFTKEYSLQINSFHATFHKPAVLNNIFHLFWNSEKNKLVIASNDELLTAIYLTFGRTINVSTKFDIQVGAALAFPNNLTVQECTEVGKNKLIYRGNIEAGKILFPALFQSYGDTIIAELGLTSEIVGMQIPGLNSLFLSIKGNFSTSFEESSFEVESYDNRFGVLSIKMQGRYLKCNIDALYRPKSPTVPKINALKNFINPNEFRNVNALIIGGSRGLGELTSKLIACGGGRVTITYYLGETDARNLQREIVGDGSYCNVLQFTIDNVFDLPSGDFNQIYYFPTPKIKSEDGRSSESKILDQYHQYYIKGFSALINQVLERSNSIKVFYPSTSFIDNPPKNFSLYAQTKLEGENLCKHFHKISGIKIFYPRLPRMATDQTISMTPELFANSVQTMLPHIRNMSSDKYI